MAKCRNSELLEEDVWSSWYPQAASAFQPTSSIHIFFPTLTSLECQDDSGYPRPEVIKSEGTLSWLNPSWQQVLPVLQTRSVRFLADHKGFDPWQGSQKKLWGRGGGGYMATVFWKRFQRCFVHHGDETKYTKEWGPWRIFSDFSDLCLGIWFSKQAQFLHRNHHCYILLRFSSTWCGISFFQEWVARRARGGLTLPSHGVKMKRLSLTFLGKKQLRSYISEHIFWEFFRTCKGIFLELFFLLINKNHTIFQGCKLQGYPLEIMNPQEVNTGAITVNGTHCWGAQTWCKYIGNVEGFPLVWGW